MTIHTPYDGSSKPFAIGLQPLDVSTWLDRDHHHDSYIAEKIRLYAEETANVLVSGEGTEAAQAEVFDLIVRHVETAHHDSGERSIAAAALLVQEDLVLMRKARDGWRLVAASVCFPSAWNLREKFNTPLQMIHQPVPGFGPATRNADLITRMFDNLWPERPVLRWNWSFYGDDRLYHPASDNRMKKRFGDGPITGKVFIRLERQTLRKLPNSGDVLFTIRIYIDPLETLANHPDGKQLAAAMAAQVEALTPEEIDYKGLVGERERLLARIRDFA